MSSEDRVHRVHLYTLLRDLASEQPHFVAARHVNFREVVRHTVIHLSRELSVHVQVHLLDWLRLPLTGLVCHDYSLRGVRQRCQVEKWRIWNVVEQLDFQSRNTSFTLSSDRQQRQPLRSQVVATPLVFVNLGDRSRPSNFHVTDATGNPDHIALTDTHVFDVDHHNHPIAAKNTRATPTMPAQTFNSAIAVFSFMRAS
ncbi:hypothetical protein [Curtobacterium phage Reje]|uniref:hypothetical protein n=1 Tax=Curtobacterium phage Reje TaxID=2851069 RepID=UPI002206EB5A|nr:hypothetical protein QEJ62_gp17 [Curtobacterium phage Reje]QXG07825.1 hypothetical protein [Curtobacterium phage Reje]